MKLILFSSTKCPQSRVYLIDWLWWIKKYWLTIDTVNTISKEVRRSTGMNCKDRLKREISHDLLCSIVVYIIANHWICVKSTFIEIPSPIKLILCTDSKPPRTCVHWHCDRPTVTNRKIITDDWQHIEGSLTGMTGEDCLKGGRLSWIISFYWPGLNGIGSEVIASAIRRARVSVVTHTTLDLVRGYWCLVEAVSDSAGAAGWYSL